MSSPYGVHPTGFIRKPLADILEEIENDLRDVFGNGVIQTPESPLGQINGIYAEAAARLWELGEDIYQSVDPDQAEGRRLDVLSKLRLLSRSGLSDIELRKQINNRSVTKFNLKDVEQALLDIEGITYLQAFLNENGAMNGDGLAVGDAAIALIGGDDTEIADALLSVLPIGGNTYGSYTVTTSPQTGVSQDFNLVRLTEKRIELALELELNDDSYNLFQPDTQQIVDGFVNGWGSNRINGRDVDSFSIRQIIESKYPAIELVNFTVTVDGGSAQTQNTEAVIAFDEIAGIVSDDVSVVFI